MNKNKEKHFWELLFKSKFRLFLLIILFVAGLIYVRGVENVNKVTIPKLVEIEFKPAKYVNVEFEEVEKSTVNKNIEFKLASGQLLTSDKKDYYQLRATHKKNDYAHARIDFGEILDDYYYIEMTGLTRGSTYSIEIGTENYHFGIYHGTNCFFFEESGDYQDYKLEQKIDLEEFNKLGVSQYKNRVKCYLNDELVMEVNMTKFDTQNQPRIFIKGKEISSTEFIFKNVKIIDKAKQIRRKK